MDDASLEKYKNLLLKAKRDILEKILRANATYADLDNKEIGDLVDQTYRYYEKEMLINMSSTDRQILNDIEIALEKIKDKTYGKCEENGCDIDPGRLEAIPWTRFCIKCAQKRTKKR